MNSGHTLIRWPPAAESVAAERRVRAPRRRAL